ncbi:MAG: amino acid adenylation domain-containing protein, partial [Blastocatellia bacterium]
VEIDHLLFDINQTGADFDLDHSIVELFERIVERRPQSTAVEFDGAALTYHQLNGRANKLARFLSSRGVGVGHVVAICLDRSIEMVVALLAVLKSGAAYLPLDPGYPRERLVFMLDDAAVKVLLTRQHLSSLSLKKELDVIELDTDWSLIAQESAEEIIDKARAEDLAYVIYTSGSTGDPKGTMITHRGICNTLQWRLRTFSLSEKDRIMQTVSFAFDPSVWQIFGALLSGATLVLPRPEALKDTAYLVKFIAEREITITDFPPSLLQVLLEEKHLENCSSLRILFSGGESLSAAIVEKFYSRLNSELYNQYGPTEATIDATYWRCIAGIDDGLVPIGRPISNTQIYLLDNNLQPVAVGVAGHLHIGGDGLARGYLGLPDLTAEKFIPNPFSLTAGSRLYCTGDRARYRASGEIEFLGRMDGQVKLRGHRIEVGEIETRLSGHKGVKEAAVILRDDQEAGRKLVGYVSIRQDYIREQEQQAGNELQAERVEQWKAIHDQEISTSGPEHQDPTFNIAGWSSSYTGLAIPAEEMRQWVEQTVARIAELKPQRVMEIGCGSGLILFRVAPGCSMYTARDFSQTSLSYIERVMKAGGNHLGQVRLEMREAADFRGVEAGQYDAVILNSVVQYFPGMAYLREVMKQAIRVVKNGGFIYIGDVRRMGLQEAFHTSVERQRGGAALRVAEIREKIEERMNEESELVVSERFFEQLKREEPRIAEIEIELKRGKHNNELTKFRYDVILHIGREDQRTSVKEIDWDREKMTVEKLGLILKSAEEDRVKIKGIINSRVERELRLVEEVKGASRDKRVDEIWKRISEEGQRGVEPERMFEIGEEQGYRAEVRWGEGTNDMEVEYRRGERVWREVEERRGGSEAEKIEDIRSYGNDPLNGVHRRKISRELREYLQERVPEIMVPSDIVVMNDLPKTTNGKIDRRALPAPCAQQVKESATFVAPQSPMEETLAGIWRELLGIERVGAEDDFFVLGGHSLLATQLISRVRTIFDLELSLQDFFMAPSIKKMAEVIEEAVFARTSSSKIDELLDLLEAAENEPQ